MKRLLAMLLVVVGWGCTNAEGTPKAEGAPDAGTEPEVVGYMTMHLHNQQGELVEEILPVYQQRPSDESEMEGTVECLLDVGRPH